VEGPDTHAGILLPVILDVEWFRRVLFTSDCGYAVRVEGGVLAQFNVGKVGASCDCFAWLHDDCTS